MLTAIWIAIVALYLLTAIWIAALLVKLVEVAQSARDGHETLDGYDTDMRDRVRLAEGRLDRLEDWASADASLELDDDTN